MKRRHFLGTAAGAAWLLSGTRAGAQTFQQQITIGVAAPLTGPRSDAGLQLLDGVRAAINETNNTIGSFGVAFAYRTFDDQDALAQTIQNVQFAAADPSIVAIVGGLDGSLTTAALPTIANAQMPLIVSASTANSITDRGYRNVWRLPTKDGTEGQLFARFLARRARPKYAIAVTQDGDYGPDVAAGFGDQAAALGMKADTYVFAWDKPDYAAAAKNIIAKKRLAQHWNVALATDGFLVGRELASGHYNDLSFGSLRVELKTQFHTVAVSEQIVQQNSSGLPS